MSLVAAGLHSGEPRDSPTGRRGPLDIDSTWTPRRLVGSSTQTASDHQPAPAPAPPEPCSRRHRAEALQIVLRAAKSKSFNRQSILSMALPLALTDAAMPRQATDACVDQTVQVPPGSDRASRNTDVPRPHLRTTPFRYFPVTPGPAKLIS